MNRNKTMKSGTVWTAKFTQLAEEDNPSRLLSSRPRHVVSNHRHRSSNRLVSIFYSVSFLIVILNIWRGHWRLESTDTSKPSFSRPGHFAGDRRKNLTRTKGDEQPRNQGELSPRQEPTHHACDGYRGIYHIEKGDIGGAAGTIFFQFVIGQLIWAELYHFKPWVYLNNVSYVIYDPVVHGRGPGVTFRMLSGMNISYIQRADGHWRDAYPGPPENIDGLVPKEFHMDGNGVWENYFEPVSDFVPGDRSCQNKPLVTMDLYLITPGVHGFAPWAPRCWRYQYLPDYVTKPHLPLHEWLEPQRRIAHRVLNKYIHFLPSIQQAASSANPDCSLHQENKSCLGIHIRQSDKAAGRRQIGTDEFLPYVEAFVQAGGNWIYLATDSGKVLQHVQSHWPAYLQSKIRTLGDNVVRSNDHQAVFDIASHHRTNTEILIEILALSKCQFLVHGLSAVTETSIWINVDLHDTSVNLEDPDYLKPKEFGSLVQSVLRGENATYIRSTQRKTDWWRAGSVLPPISSTHSACSDGVDGVLHIAHVGTIAAAGTAFFTSVLNQLLYAERHHLKPWIHLSNESSYIYDDIVHGIGDGVTLDATNALDIEIARLESNTSYFYPGSPLRTHNPSMKHFTYQGTGVWGHYFQPVSDFVPGDKSCIHKPLLSMSSELVMPGLYSWCPWSLKAWRYNDVPEDIWNPQNITLKEWMKPMRREASLIVQKYYRFRPHIIQRAEEVNPTANGTNNIQPCLAVHIRNSDKRGLYRNKFPPNKFREYMMAFVRAGGRNIYVASDSHSKIEYIEKHFPAQLKGIIRTQGPYVVRSTSKWPIHQLERHHRTNSEVLVDILAMSKCSLLLHGHSAVSEAAIYLNPTLIENSVNWEDEDRMSVQEFEIHARKVLGENEFATLKSSAVHQPQEEVISPSQRLEPAAVLIKNVTVLPGSDRKCRKNAIVYLAQKRHSTYNRDSYGSLMQSLELMDKNYLSLGNHRQNADVIIFHTADFDFGDLEAFESRFGVEFRNVVRLIDLSNTQYWQRPKWHEHDNPGSWYAYPQFSEGYRRMMHWFAIDIWRFFGDYKSQTGCNYEYIMRFDEDSFLHSPIKYDIFDFMKNNGYYYGFRLCSYEMQVTQRIWKLWRQSGQSPAPIREIDSQMCGVYNNFFVADLKFFQSPEVVKFLKFVDRQGMIYRRRLGDLMIHSMAIYSFAPAEKIHRFLDFTYEHGTVDTATGCVMWGGIQAGYDDPNAEETITNYYEIKVVQKGCKANLTVLNERGLSPTYAHIPSEIKGNVLLKTITAGHVELRGKGILSG